MTSDNPNIDVILEIFRRIEQRDLERPNEDGAAALFHPDLELHWPPSLPYGGVARGGRRDRPTWSDTWTPLQPTDAERRMDPRVIAASGDEIVVLWRQRGVTPDGERLDTEVLGLYRMRDGQLARGQMFYFDPAGVEQFLSRAKELLDRRTARQ